MFLHWLLPEARKLRGREFDAQLLYLFQIYLLEKNKKFGFHF